MKKVKAFSLIEVIVSIAIIGILAVGMLPVMSGGLMFLNRSKDITQNIFDAQKDMEFTIESIKANPSGLTPKTIKVFDGHDIEVAYYEVTTEKNGRKYSTFVSETRPLKYKMLSLTGAKAVANNNLNLKVVEGRSGNQVEARHNAITDSEYFKTSYQWYKSRKGFNIPIPDSGVTEVEIGTIYPVFPHDYEPLPLNFDTTRLNDLTDLAGRHVLFTAEPVSIYGKFGLKSISNTIYVAETMFSDKLRLHLDASMIDEQNTTQIRKAGNDSYVKSWTNLSKTSNNATEGNDNRQPLVLTNAPHTDFNGKYVAFRAEASNNSNNNRLTVSGYTEIFTGSYDLFVVINGDDDEVVKHGDLKINVYDNPPNNSSNGTNKINANIISIGNGWKVAKVSNYTPTYQNSNTNKFVIENVNVNIAEVLVYSNLSNNDEIEVLNFLLEKYKMNGEAVEIDRLHDNSVELFRDESYSLPVSVFATFDGGKTGYVPVAWNSSAYATGGIVDTSQIRTMTFTGYATSDSTKTVNLEVVVKPITQLTGVVVNPINLPLIVGNTKTMTFTFAPSNASIQSIKWTSSNSGVATINQSTGELVTVSNGKTAITVEANGIASASYEVVVGNIQPVSAGLVLHLDASDSSTVIRNGSNVSEWRDKSGGNNTFIQNTNNNRPSYSNGKVQFNSNPNQYLQRTGNLSGLEFFTSKGGDFTLFVVGKTTTPSSGWRAYLSQYMTDSTSFLFGRNSSGQIESNVNNAVNPLRSATNGELNVYTVSNQSGTLKQWSNGNLQATGNYTNASSQGSRVFIGAGYGGGANYLNGEIGEIIVYNRVLSELERTQIEVYLKSKWID